MKQPHYLQLQILKKLLFSPGLKYSELRPDDSIENNKLSFHLDTLVSQGLVNKKGDKYILTLIGKEYANRMDTEKIQIKKQGKIGVVPCCVRNIDGKKEYLIYTRLKHPFYGYQGFPTGKIDYGESVFDAARRELQEETNLKGDPELFCITHYTVYDKKHNLLEDKYFYFMKVENPLGELKANNEGKHEWVKESEVKQYITKPFDDFWISLGELQNFKGELIFRENKHITDGF